MERRMRWKSHVRCGAGEKVESGVWIPLRPYLSLLILLPINQEEDREAQARQLADIVLEVNDTQLREEELLSYHVYQYCRETGEIVIAM